MTVQARPGRLHESDRSPRALRGGRARGQIRLLVADREERL
jgi:hypothetical protein